MKQAIPGVSPPKASEVTVMTVWPSIAATGAGRMLGRLCLIKVGFGNVFTVGKLLALAVIPVAIPIFFAMLIPGAGIPGTFLWIDNPFCRRYRLTNRRIIVEHGLGGREQRSIPLDDFDAIDVKILPGQAWYPAGDLLFRKGPVETFRISGVSRPETFRQTCLKAQRGFVGARKAVEFQSAS